MSLFNENNKPSFLGGEPFLNKTSPNPEHGRVFDLPKPKAKPVETPKPVEKTDPQKDGTIFHGEDSTYTDVVAKALEKSKEMHDKLRAAGVPEYEIKDEVKKMEERVLQKGSSATYKTRLRDAAGKEEHDALQQAIAHPDEYRENKIRRAEGEALKDIVKKEK